MNKHKTKLASIAKERVAKTERADELNRKGRRRAVKITMRSITELRKDPNTRTLELHAKAKAKRKIKNKMKKIHGK